MAVSRQSNRGPACYKAFKGQQGYVLQRDAFPRWSLAFVQGIWQVGHQPLHGARLVSSTRSEIICTLLPSAQVWAAQHGRDVEQAPGAPTVQHALQLHIR